MRSLYPPIQPYNTFTLGVEPPHELYVEECGTPDGLPVVFLHGGPGAGCEAYHRQFFDPEKYRIVLFDQRGCGRSTPHAELQGNTTQALIGDIETIRQRLGINQWVVFGGSWGSTLALAYAQAHPDRVLGLILRGIFLCRQREIDWFYQEGASRIFPDVWEKFLEPIPAAEHDALVKAYYQRLTSDDEFTRMQAAKAWSLWEGRTSTLIGSQKVLDHFGSGHTALSLARIECHYFMHQSFLRENQLLDDAQLIQDIPGIIVQGRYDVVCPLESAWELHRAWPGSILQIIPDAGHSATETGITNALVKATDDMYRDLE
ncbi:MAG: prolyl aminopeptidase [Gammaproteobacteria bacterium]|nr:prolyl aminopeptidase [Gammaproteobacteria bacterium]